MRTTCKRRGAAARILLIVPATASGQLSGALDGTAAPDSDSQRKAPVLSTKTPTETRLAPQSKTTIRRNDTGLN